MRLPANQAAALAALLVLAGCGGPGKAPRTALLPAQPANGPAADYPMVLGAPFTVGSQTYTPVDRMNYDAVGIAAIGAEGGEGVSAAHKTLPLPSYAEVTELDGGKTILVRVERRGPMDNAQLIELSPGAAAQLGLGEGNRPAVRVRRVNPPEAERALLRAGQRAPARMETPKPLLGVLLRKLEPQPAPAPAVAIAPRPSPSARPTPAPRPAPAPKPSTAEAPAVPVATTPAPTSAGSLVVQAAAFSTRARADAAAAALGGEVQPSGRLFRVRIGPFAERRLAEAGLAKARSAGYSDARIQRSD